jgi:N-acetylmuramoyl-L-alanine amidase
MKHLIGLTIAMVFCCSTLLAQDNDPNKIRTVVIDPGHGGKDPGNLGTKTMKKTEKDVTLAVSKLLGNYIEESFPDVKVIYTRDSDVFIGLKERTKLANEANADLFISVHCNSNERKEAVGADTWVMGLHKTQSNLKTAQRENATILLEEGHELKYDGFDPNAPESMIALSLRQNIHLEQSLTLSAMIQEQFRERVGRVDRGVKQAGFYVISYTTMPSVLVELGFLTNDKEEKFLQSDQGQDYMASAIFRAFKQYKTQIESVETTVGITQAPAIDSDILFKVQIVTTQKKIPLKPKNFNGIEGVEEYQDNGMFKYTAGNSASLKDVRKTLETCREKGYQQAFIVAFRNGERIGLEEAVKLAQVQ